MGSTAGHSKPKYLASQFFFSFSLLSHGEGVLANTMELMTPIAWSLLIFPVNIAVAEIPTTMRLKRKKPMVLKELFEYTLRRAVGTELFDEEIDGSLSWLLLIIFLSSARASLLISLVTNWVSLSLTAGEFGAALVILYDSTTQKFTA